MASEAFNLLCSEVILARSTELARSADYDAARTVLSALYSAEPQNVRALDLLARISAQQGRLGEARAFWERALTIEPDNLTYKSAIGRVAITEARSRLMRPRLAISILVVLVLVGAVVLYSISRRTSRGSTARTAESPIAPQTTEAERKQPEATWPALNIEGVTAEEVSRGRLITFQSGMFSTGTRLAPSARSVLARVGRAIESDSRNLHVEIVGHSDSLPLKSTSRFRDNTELEISRALTIFDELRRITKIPASAFSIASAGNGRPQPSRTEPAPETRGRTVTILLTRPQGN